MEDMQNQINAILGNPEMMQKIMAMAQSLGTSASPEQAQPRKEHPPQEQQEDPAFPDIDISMLQKLSGFVKGTGIDKNQQSLLHALGPYLSRERIGKLDKAMRAAKLARAASSFLGQNGILNLSGR